MTDYTKWTIDQLFKEAERLGRELEHHQKNPTIAGLAHTVTIIPELANVYEATAYQLLNIADALRGEMRNGQ